MDQSDNQAYKRTEPLYTLSVASRLSNTPTHSVRQYIDKGLILPFKTKNKRHLFSDVDISRLKCIRKHLDEQGLNIAGINALFALVPCWIIKPCSIEDRENCDAYSEIKKPCWQASNKGPECKNTDCRLCSVYQLPEKCVNLKDFIKKITNT
ncbi:MAG: MerR family transcriptional regulator [Bacteroidia bacterium]|nr:MerR family transcriptional regulator [Bacteroidia bacterium]NNF31310.1 MerR family transcriptional regulator [Flavobacteriaceae bacterium]MBT8274598.1 MerR family transcriptional regulator [Bacteroidia bacterium]NNJ82140.1 MerR family transcriptional regulator [Flavobacteriaceae bacterium]NNK54232.1 MerR family transcriptional regulator [Flavobacteriaceae bacterium]